MKKTSTTSTIETDSDDLRPEYRFDYSKARRNRFARPGDKRKLIIITDPDIVVDFNASKFKTLVSDKWHEFAADLPAMREQLGLETNHGLLLASVLIPLLQAYETDVETTMVSLHDLLIGIDQHMLVGFTTRFLESTGSFWELEKIVRDDPAMTRVFDMLIEQGDAKQAAQAALGAEWKHFADQLREEQAHST